MLVEIIKGEQTGDAALATALDYVRAIKKTPIVVNDSRGFFANRCVGAYLYEGHKMLIEGIPAAMIENAGRQAGMPVGPLSLTDEVAVDLALKIVKATEAQLGAEAIDPDQKALLTTLVEGEGRLGRKNRKGFYDYPEGASKKLWPGLSELQTTRIDPDDVDFTELKQRLLVVQALEAARTVGEGVITDPREADVGSILAASASPLSPAAPCPTSTSWVRKRSWPWPRAWRQSTGRVSQCRRTSCAWRRPAARSTARPLPRRRRERTPRLGTFPGRGHMTGGSVP